MGSEFIWRTATLAVTVGLLSQSAPAQQQSAQIAGGPLLTFGISSSLRANDNLQLDPTSPGTTVFVDNTLSFGFAQQTQISSLALDASTVLRAADLPITGYDTSVDNQRLRLAYDRAVSNSRLALSASYDRTSLQFLDPFALEVINGSDLIQSRGTRTGNALGFTYETGLTAPIGFLLQAKRSERSYSSDADPALYASQNTSLSGTLRFTLSPVLDTRLTLSDQRYQARTTSCRPTATPTAPASAPPTTSARPPWSTPASASATRPRTGSTAPPRPTA